MKISELSSKLTYRLLTPQYQDADIQTGYTSDLLSDVLGNAPDDCALITIQAHKNTVAVAFQVGAGAVIICNNREAPADMLEMAAREGIAVFATTDSQYQASIRLHSVLTGQP